MWKTLSVHGIRVGNICCDCYGHTLSRGIIGIGNGAAQEGSNVIPNGAKRSEESANVNQILHPTCETAGLRMTFGTAPSNHEMLFDQLHLSRLGYATGGQAVEVHAA